jgi:hypothetical protein
MAAGNPHQFCSNVLAHDDRIQMMEGFKAVVTIPPALPLKTARHDCSTPAVLRIGLDPVQAFLTAGIALHPEGVLIQVKSLWRNRFSDTPRKTRGVSAKRGYPG